MDQEKTQERKKETKSERKKDKQEKGEVKVASLLGSSPFHHSERLF